MDNTDLLGESVKGKTGGGRLWMVLIAVLAVGLAITVVVFHYRVHLLWCYQSQRLGLDNVEAIPSRPMPESPVPEGWIRCSVGKMTILLPPEFSELEEASAVRDTVRNFTDGSRTVLLCAPDNAPLDFCDTASKLCPRSCHYTLPKLRLACYQARSDDFRWSMTAEEVRWHSFLMTMRRLMECGCTDRVETLFGADLDGILCYGKDRAVFDWQSCNGNWGSYVWFRGGTDDPEWIRTACRSVEVVPDAEQTAEVTPREEPIKEHEDLGIFP